MPVLPIVSTRDIGSVSGLPVTRAESVNGSDVGVIQRRQRLRFALEPRHAFGVLGERLRQHLQRHVTGELGVAGARYLAHPASAKRQRRSRAGRILLVSFTVAGGSLTDPLPGNYRFVSVVALSST